MQRINVLSIQRISAEDRAKIEAVDPAIELTDAGAGMTGKFAKRGLPSPRHATWHQAPRARGPARNAIASSPKLK
jgi:hypothetical protein